MWTIYDKFKWDTPSTAAVSSVVIIMKRIVTMEFVFRQIIVHVMLDGKDIFAKNVLNCLDVKMVFVKKPMNVNAIRDGQELFVIVVSFAKNSFW